MLKVPSSSAMPSQELTVSEKMASPDAKSVEKFQEMTSSGLKKLSDNEGLIHSWEDAFKEVFHQPTQDLPSSRTIPFQEKGDKSSRKEDPLFAPSQPETSPVSPQGGKSPDQEFFPFARSFTDSRQNPVSPESARENSDFESPSFPKSGSQSAPDSLEKTYEDTRSGTASPDSFANLQESSVSTGEASLSGKESAFAHPSEPPKETCDFPQPEAAGNALGAKIPSESATDHSPQPARELTEGDAQPVAKPAPSSSQVTSTASASGVSRASSAVELSAGSSLPRMKAESGKARQADITSSTVSASSASPKAMPSVENPSEARHSNSLPSQPSQDRLESRVSAKPAPSHVEAASPMEAKVDRQDLPTPLAPLAYFEQQAPASTSERSPSELGDVSPQIRLEFPPDSLAEPHVQESGDHSDATPLVSEPSKTISKAGEPSLELPFPEKISPELTVPEASLMGAEAQAGDPGGKADDSTQGRESVRSTPLQEAVIESKSGELQAEPKFAVRKYESDLLSRTSMTVSSQSETASSREGAVEVGLAKESNPESGISAEKREGSSAPLPQKGSVTSNSLPIIAETPSSQPDVSHMPSGESVAPSAQELIPKGETQAENIHPETVRVSRDSTQRLDHEVPVSTQAESVDDTPVGNAVPSSEKTKSSPESLPLQDHAHRADPSGAETAMEEAIIEMSVVSGVMRPAPPIEGAGKTSSETAFTPKSDQQTPLERFGAGLRQMALRGAVESLQKESANSPEPTITLRFPESQLPGTTVTLTLSGTALSVGFRTNSLESQQVLSAVAREHLAASIHQAVRHDVISDVRVTLSDRDEEGTGKTSDNEIPEGLIPKIHSDSSSRSF